MVIGQQIKTIRADFQPQTVRATKLAAFGYNRENLIFSCLDFFDWFDVVEFQFAAG